jgi:hypothetical protein
MGRCLLVREGLNHYLDARGKVDQPSGLLTRRAFLVSPTAQDLRAQG